MATFAQRITALWTGRPIAPPAVTYEPTPTQPSSLAESFGAVAARRNKVLENRAMYDDDPRPEQSISTLARDVVKGGFTFQITGARSAEAQTIADDLVKRLDLFGRLDDWMRLTLVDGDSFLEVGIAATNEITEVTRKPTLEMYRYSDERDKFTDPAQAYYYSSRPTLNEQPPKDALWFAEWQIIHARWGRDEGQRYGKPLFNSARTAYKRVKQGELDVAVRRKTRAGQRFVHTLEDASPTDIEAYKRANQAALDDPFAAVADFFTNKRGGIQAIQGDANLAQIEDVLHHVDTFGIASPVPLELIGYGRNLNRDVLEQKKEQYEETLGAVRKWVHGNIIKPLVELQWLLKGIYPDALTWEVQWKTKKEPAPADLQALGAFVTAMKASGLLTDETLIRFLGTVLPDFDVEAEIKAVEALQKEKEDIALKMAQDVAGDAQDAQDGPPVRNDEPAPEKGKVA
jgi:hypothetical protein